MRNSILSTHNKCKYNTNTNTNANTNTHTTNLTTNANLCQFVGGFLEWWGVKGWRGISPIYLSLPVNKRGSALPTSPFMQLYFCISTVFLFQVYFCFNCICHCPVNNGGSTLPLLPSKPLWILFQLYFCISTVFVSVKWILFQLCFCISTAFLFQLYFFFNCICLKGAVIKQHYFSLHANVFNCCFVF